MEFLVSIEVRLPPDMDPAARETVLAGETTRGQELMKAGVIVRIWRVPGRLANVAIWQAANATELHELLTSLPVWPYAQIEVTALATHPLEADSIV
jgi:muconolactone D-isomerase